MVAMGIIFGATVVVAQEANQPWMNTKLSPEERAELVLKQMTLDEKLALLHGNGMAHAPQWQMPLTHLGNVAQAMSKALSASAYLHLSSRTRRTE
jgi:beta-glucosidase